MRSGSPQLKQFLGREMLRGAFAAVAGAGPNQQAELLHLARDILATDSPFPAAPREVDMLRWCLAGTDLAFNPAQLFCGRKISLMAGVCCPVTVLTGCCYACAGLHSLGQVQGMPVSSLDQMHPFAMAGRASEMLAVLCQSRFALSSPASVSSPI